MAYVTDNINKRYSCGGLRQASLSSNILSFLKCGYMGGCMEQISGTTLNPKS